MALNPTDDHTRREAIADWLRANAIDPGEVPVNGHLFTTTKPDGVRVIQYTVLAADGRFEAREAPLLVEHPEYLPWITDRQRIDNAIAVIREWQRDGEPNDYITRIYRALSPPASGDSSSG